MAMMCAADCGECVHQVFSGAEEYKDKVVGLGAENLKIEEYAAILNKQFDGKKFVASTVSGNKPKRPYTWQIQEDQER